MWASTRPATLTEVTVVGSPCQHLPSCASIWSEKGTITKCLLSQAPEADLLAFLPNCHVTFQFFSSCTESPLHIRKQMLNTLSQLRLQPRHRPVIQCRLIESEGCTGLLRRLPWWEICNDKCPPFCFANYPMQDMIPGATAAKRIPEKLT